MDNRKALIAIALLGALLAMAVALFMAGGGGGPSPGALGSPQKQTFLLIVAVIGLIAIAFVVFYIRTVSRVRRKDWQDRADAIGDAVNLDFEQDIPKNFHRDFTFLPEIKKSGKTSRLARGSIAGHAALFFEHYYVVSTGQTTQTIYHCVYSTEAPNWPQCSVTPRGPISKLLRKLGRRKGLLLDDPAFNDAYVVNCEDEPFAVTLLTPEMQRFMLEKTNTRWRILRGRVFLVYRGRLKLERMPVSVNRLERFWSHVPREVQAWERRGMV